MILIIKHKNSNHDKLYNKNFTCTTKNPSLFVVIQHDPPSKSFRQSLTFPCRHKIYKFFLTFLIKKQLETFN